MTFLIIKDAEGKEIDRIRFEFVEPDDPFLDPVIKRFEARGYTVTLEHTPDIPPHDGHIQ